MSTIMKAYRRRKYQAINEISQQPWRHRRKWLWLINAESEGGYHGGSGCENGLADDAYLNENESVAASMAAGLGVASLKARKLMKEINGGVKRGVNRRGCCAARTARWRPRCISLRTLLAAEARSGAHCMALLQRAAELRAYGRAARSNIAATCVA
jgi:hypothetical protein